MAFTAAGAARALPLASPSTCGRSSPLAASLYVRLGGQLHHGELRPAPWTTPRIPGARLCRQCARRRRGAQPVWAWGGHAAAVGGAKASAAVRAEACLRLPLWQHFLLTAVIVTGALSLASFLSSALHKEANRVEAGEELVSLNGGEVATENKKGVVRQALESAFIAIHRPAAIFLPVVAIIASLRSVANLLEAVNVYQAQHAVPQWLASGAKTASATLRGLDHLILEVSEVALIAFTVWTIIRLKERLIRIMVDNDTRDGTSISQESRALERVILPLSGLSSWLVVLVGCLMALHVLGINIQPLLTVGGVSGIIVGLSAQSLMANMISGINLFLSRPFVVGDRIDITSASGSKFTTGYVERVDPMRTILRTDACLPIMIPNKVLAEMVISNESRIQRSRVVTNFARARQYIGHISVRYNDMDKVESMVAAMRRHLETSDAIDRRLPMHVGLASLDNYACNIHIVLHTSMTGTRDFGTFRQRLLLAFGDIIRDHGARLAYPTQITQVHPLGMKDEAATMEVAGHGATAAFTHPTAASAAAAIP